MDIRQLRYFTKVIEFGNLTAAADVLNVSQPALGMQVRKLEEELDTPLIQRHSRGVKPTDAGKLLFQHAIDILARVAIAEDELGRFSQTPSGTVRLGVTPSLGRALVPALLELCADRHPEMKILFAQNFTDQLYHDLHSGKMDFVLTHSVIETGKYETVPLYTETMSLIGKPALIPDNNNAPVSVEQLARVPLALDERSQHVRQIIDSATQKQQIELQDVVEIQAINIRRELVMQGRRCSIAPVALFSTEIESGQVVATDIDIADLTRIIHLAGPRVEQMTRAEAAVRSLIIELVDNNIEHDRFGWKMPVM